ncbi:metallophosphoesterase family protein [Leptolyngbya sp. NIES-2104]|uniref:metallophosphoesterase family protein n=1 Tax=Leptolyngbya sp. NIES-2104 TaxID=1552121 RepID=UPI0006EC9E33|nr:metallophosphoesterase [Leptolyngbya sp. NIES-2104]GAP98656.1 ATPase [Leptolyngbya sp. NIES-2104]
MMRFVSDPATSLKIEKMQERVRWRNPKVIDRGIDQTRLAIDDAKEQEAFSFLVIGDSGSGRHPGHSPQRRITEQMLPHREECRFVLHTGDVVYLVGSSEFYPQNFIEPYREFIVGGENPKNITFDQMVFNLPFLPVLGNHDYYDLPIFYGVLAQLSYPVRRVLRSRIDFDIRFHGSYQGRAFAQAFMDLLSTADQQGKLAAHLDQHYTAETSTGRCLKYEPGSFTRLPNRYYTFRYGGIDFFALDSNTINEPVLPSTDQSDRQKLIEQRDAIEQEKQQLVLEMGRMDVSEPEQSDQADDIRVKLQQLEEIQIDIEKQLNPSANVTVDYEQLDWLRDRLVQSWQDPEVRGRIIYFHHPPYVTEATKWYQAQTFAVRYRLRQVFDDVVKQIDPKGRPIVDLVLNGHAHCFEYLRTVDTGHADSNINWVVCGGSGYSLRRQREEGAEITERDGLEEKIVAKSQLFVGRTGQGSNKQRPYSFLRIDVTADDPVKLILRPYVSEWSKRQWHDRALDPIVIG